MKKVFLLILLIVLCGCSESKKEEFTPQKRTCTKSNGLDATVTKEEITIKTISNSDIEVKEFSGFNRDANESIKDMICSSTKKIADSKGGSVSCTSSSVTYTYDTNDSMDDVISYYEGKGYYCPLDKYENDSSYEKEIVGNTWCIYYEDNESFTFLDNNTVDVISVHNNSSGGVTSKDNYPYMIKDDCVTISYGTFDRKLKYKDNKLYIENELKSSDKYYMYKCDGITSYDKVKIEYKLDNKLSGIMPASYNTRFKNAKCTDGNSVTFDSDAWKYKIKENIDSTCTLYFETIDK